MMNRTPAETYTNSTKLFLRDLSEMGYSSNSSTYGGSSGSSTTQIRLFKDIYVAFSDTELGELANESLHIGDMLIDADPKDNNRLVCILKMEELRFQKELEPVIEKLSEKYNMRLVFNKLACEISPDLSDDIDFLLFEDFEDYE
ncbi:MAG TPA: hypothetical protein ENN46_01830 [Candidatus Woesearchaeota archaeon]|nr:hypothetical protein [Candidatus Woesearchaeota archaeon]